MAASSPRSRGNGVFLNIPFDSGYEKFFAALIASIVAARLVPRCAVELPERGEGQFNRIMKLLAGCELSVHDLSRANRFNMPFELGLSVALDTRQHHQFILLETRRGTTHRRLTDMRRIEPIAHGGSALRLIALLADNLGARPAIAEAIYRELAAILPLLKREYRVPDAFHKTIFEELVSGAVEHAEKLGVFA